jgi:hypothetical protein
MVRDHFLANLRVQMWIIVFGCYEALWGLFNVAAPVIVFQWDYVLFYLSEG